MLDGTDGARALQAVTQLSVKRRRASRSRTLPELPQVSADFATGGAPVGLDAVPELRDMAFDVQFVLLQPADIQFLAAGSSL